MLLKQIKNACNRHPEGFQKYHIMVSDFVSKIAATLINPKREFSKRSNGLLVTLVKQVICEGSILIIFITLGLDKQVQSLGSSNSTTSKFSFWEVAIPFITLVKTTLAGVLKL